MHSLRQLMRRKAYRTFFLSFVAIFLVPVLVLTLVLSRFATTVRQESRMSARLVLEQFISGVDGQLYTVMRLADSALVDDKAIFFAEREDPMRYLNNITTFQMLKNLTQEVGIMPMTYADVEQCYLYMPRSGMVISNTITEAGDFYQRKLSGAFESAEAWLAFLSQQRDGFFRHGTVQYMRTAQRGHSDLLTVVIAMGDLPFDNYRALFDAQASIDAAVFSGTGEALYHTGEHAPVLPDAIRDQAQGEGLFPLGGGETLRVHWKHSLETGCIFLTTTPDAQYLRPLHTLYATTAVGGLALLIVGIWLSLLLARRQYRPILALRGFIDRSARRQSDEHADDFEYLSEMMRVMDQESKTAAQQARDTQGKMEQFALERLLKGMYSSTLDMEEQLLALNITLDSERYLVAGMRINGLDEGQPPALALEDRQLMRFVACNVFDELLDAYHPETTVSDGLVWVICALPAGASWQQGMQALLENGRQFLLERFNFRLAIGTSDVVSGLDGIHRGYRTALSMLRRAETQQADLLLGFDAAQPAEAADVQSMNAQAQHLGQLISEGDEAGTRQFLDGLQTRLAAMPHYLAHLHWNALLQGLLAFLHGFDDAQQQDIQRRIRAFAEGGPLQDDYAEMASLCAYLCGLPRAQTDGGRGLDIAQRVRQYIEENYASSSLNITEIADHLGLTASYASALYKRQTGESMLDAINQVRLRHAKNLLWESSLTIDEISLQAGYYSTSTFLRAFRKYEGITPGQFRAMAGRR